MSVDMHTSYIFTMLQALLPFIFINHARESWFYRSQQGSNYMKIETRRQLEAFMSFLQNITQLNIMQIYWMQAIIILTSSKFFSGAIVHKSVLSECILFLCIERKNLIHKLVLNYLNIVYQLCPAIYSLDWYNSFEWVKTSLVLNKHNFVYLESFLQNQHNSNF